MILIEFLLAPTVPSEPRPQKLAGDDSCGRRVGLLVDREREIRHIVHDADCEVVLRRLGLDVAVCGD